VVGRSLQPCGSSLACSRYAASVPAGDEVVARQNFSTRASPDGRVLRVTMLRVGAIAIIAVGQI
jgi:hypothetical protein